MRVALASDHAGFRLKEKVKVELRKDGYEVDDLGVAGDEQSSDYPDAATVACEAVRAGRAERGLVVCGSGVGVTVAANKYPRIRAGLCHDTYSAHQGVEHDDMNVLCLGARVVGEALAIEIVHAFLRAKFTGEERHSRRLAKVVAIERAYMKEA